MNRLSISVPKDLRYISDWEDFDSNLPKGHVILNKVICGCGCTNYYLSNSQPVILLSPRREMLHSKSKYFGNRVFYFDRSDSNIPVEKTISDLNQYLNGCVSNPPKILVTYDSMPILIQTLPQINIFTIVVDEFTCLFTDVLYKGLVEMNLLHQLQSFPNHVVYISATVIDGKYLEQIGAFKNLPYVTLDWDMSRLETVRLVPVKMRSPQKSIKEIIEFYRSNGYFRTTMIDGQEVYSKEAVFFLNNVSTIISVCKSCGLTPSDTLIICANTPTNVEKLAKIGMTIGHAYGKNEYKTLNKPFTFVTKCSFEGTDLYSDSSTTYVFSNPSTNCMALDISIDLPQICGRCRTVNNPFRSEVYVYYSTKYDKTEIEKELERIRNRENITQEILQNPIITSEPILRKLSIAQEKQHYMEDYVDVVRNSDGSLRAIDNTLARLAQIRALEIQERQYANDNLLFQHMSNEGFRVVDNNVATNEELNGFWNFYHSTSDFSKLMHGYCSFLDTYPHHKKEVESWSSVNQNIKDYYNILGSVRIKALRFREKDIVSEISQLKRFPEVIEKLSYVLEKGTHYSNADLKVIIQEVYDNLGIKKTAKASDIKQFFPSATYKKVILKVNGKRQGIEGFVI